MTDLISDNSQPQLRKVTLAGNARRRPGQKTQRDADFFWVLSAAAPYFGRQHTFDEFGKASGVNADHVYPLRVLSADQPRLGTGGGAPWRRPRLIDLHLLVGAANDAYSEHEDDPNRVDRLIVNFSKPSVVEAKKGTLLRTFPEADEPPTTGVKDAPFVRTVVEPLPIDEQQWPPFASSTIIPVPPLRLVAGRVGLRVALVNAKGQVTKELAWLRKLGIESQKEDKAVWASIWLVPDGIEFDAVFNAFPGSSAQQLSGRVRLAADDDGRFYLNLLSAKDESKWRDAWARITPAARDNREDDLLGLKFAANHDGSVPGFRWPVKLRNGIPDSLDPMQISQRALRVELVSPSEHGDVDGVAPLATGWVEARENADKVTFTFGSESTVSSPSVLKISSLQRSMEAKFGAIAPLGVHVDRLAADLRAAYGLEDPPVVPPVEGGAPAGAAFARPLLPAFVPLADGWLQLPVPNLGPRDTAQDIELAATPASEQKTSMFGDGFFRLKRLGLPAVVLTEGGGPFGSGTQAPWAVTIARPTALRGVVDVQPGKDPGSQGKPATALLEKADIYLDGFSLGARGLIWMSADRPDAFEALPRLGAGPGSFIDLAFESGTSDLLQVSVSALTIKAVRDEKEINSKPMELERVDLAIDFDGKGTRWIGEVLRPREARDALRAAVAVVDGQAAAKAVDTTLATGEATLPWSPVVWQRHQAIPLAATMPMTRAAAGAVRPLESRDLIPFVLKTTAVAKRQRLATLRIANGIPFASLSGDGLEYKLVGLASSWPQEPGNDGNGNPDRGIAFAALGLPGVELRPVPDSSFYNAIPYLASVRFDLPALDEAFATAPLPPQPGGPASAEERDMPPPKPVATALDWPLLAELWQGQERKHQNSRVADSYMMPFKSVNVGVPESKVDVKTLVKGLTWSGVSIQVGTKPVAGKLPYGTLAIDGESAQSGNDVLRGLTGKFTPNLATKTLQRTTDGPLDVLGSSPATFKSGGAGDYFDLDNRLTGIKPPVAISGVLSRPVMVADKQNLRLVSLLAPVSVKTNLPGQATPRQKFLFWFKDVLFKDDGAAILAQDDSIAFDVWDNAEKLAGAGLEWRLVPALASDAEAAFRLGRNQMPFFGFRLEPLRLTALSLKNDKVEKASILCRLTLGEPARSPDPALNVVKLNLTSNADGTLGASFENTPAKSPLRFSFTVAEASGMKRRVTIESGFASGSNFASISDLKVSRFAIAIADVDVAFTTAQVSFALRPADVGAETVSFSAGRDSQTIDPGAGRLRIAQAKLTAGLELRNPPGLLSIDPKLELKYVAEIVPRGESKTSPSGTLSFERNNTGNGNLSIFGRNVSLPVDAVHEGDGAIVLAVTDQPVADVPWKASLGLAARVKQAATDGEGAAELVFGHCDADLAPSNGKAIIGLGTDIEATDARVKFTLSNAGVKGSDFWQGTATVSGLVTAKNSINWPSVAWTSPPAIPLPGKPKDSNARVKVTKGPASAASHNVTWVFSDHRLDLALAAALAGKSGTALWTTLVTARHTISRGGKTLQWSGVESIAVGYPAAMIPKIPSDLNTDSTTFAARYRGTIKNSNYVVQQEPGMHRPGLGAVATVLQGALGAAFRKAFWATPSDGLMVMGGFLGALRSGAASAVPLLRLPVLAGLGAGKIGQTVPTQGLELSWTDGPAARLLALTRPGAPSPADTSLDALHAAALAGSLPFPELRDGESLDDPVGAILVEQSYVNVDLAADASLATTPFFLASAIAVERTLGQPSASGPMESLSLIAAGSVLRDKGKASRTLSLAAALGLRDRDLLPSPKQSLPHCALVGDRLTVSDWPGASDEGSATQLPMLKGLAVARDTNPRAAFVGVSPAKGMVTAQYFPHAFLPAALDAPAIPATLDGSFADHGRGAIASAAGAEPLRWLAPVVEGAGRPIRDYDNDTGSGSGLAGLTRRARLPAHTGPAIELAKEDANDEFVWLSQTQLPIYLPLQTTGLKGPPIGWLTPAPPLARLPSSGNVLQAIRASSDNEGEVPGGRRREVQPFTPQELSAASVGERAGIMTARRARLLGGLGTISAFDPMYARFGRPAQAGSSFARQIRTPRPARLPENIDDALRDRRIQASSVDPKNPFAAVIGSADIVEGVGIGGKDGAWSIRVVAAPEWESTVSDLWDGTVRLACRMFVGSEDEPASQPRDLLGQALIEGTAGKLATRGILRIGNAMIPFSHASFRTAKEWKEYSTKAKKTFCADIDVILSLKGSTRRVANSDVAAAFSAPGALPAVEVQWTVHPSSMRSTNVVTNGELPLTITDPKQPELARGADRAPLTLRMALYPITAIRGALPLTPATLLFADPAYDRDLAGPPAADGRKLELTEAARELLPAGRGDLRLVLTADRGQLNRLGTVTFMLDVRFERPMDDIAQAIAENATAAPGGDLTREQAKAVATLRLELQPKGQPARPLRFGKDAVEIKLGDLYELPLSAVTEADGAPAKLSAGDILVMETALNDRDVTAVFWNSAGGGETAAIDLLPEQNAQGNIPSCSLRFVLTDDPVIEPPPALYAALMRTGLEASSRLSVPLHAQSPLPWRVDLVDPVRDFRHGMMRRHAAFIWTLVRPRTEFGSKCLYVIKADRNGQTYLPEGADKLLQPE